jgi:hypothetical protein
MRTLQEQRDAKSPAASCLMKPTVGSAAAAAVKHKSDQTWMPMAWTKTNK